MELLRRAAKPLYTGLRHRRQHPFSVRLCTRLSHVVFQDAELKDECSHGFIHPTAFVHPNATLGQGVSIGPFCTVGSSVKLGNASKLYPGSHVFGNSCLGDNCTLMSGAIVGDELPGHTVIGSNNLIGHHAVVGVKCQDLKYKKGDECFLNIGDNNEIREHTSIHRSSKPDDRTVIGNNNLIMGSCHVAHDCKIGNYNILANNTLLAGHIVIEDHVHTAGATVIHQHCHLGSFCFVAGGSVISQDVPRFVMVSGERAELRGLNLEGLRRHGFSPLEIKSLRAAYRKIFMPQIADSLSIEDRLTYVIKRERDTHTHSKLIVRRSMRNYPKFKQCSPWWNLFVIPSVSFAEEYASSNIGLSPDNLSKQEINQHGCCVLLHSGNLIFPTLRALLFFQLEYLMGIVLKNQITESSSFMCTKFRV